MRGEGVMDRGETRALQATPKAEQLQREQKTKQHTKRFFASCTRRTISMREMRKAKEAKAYEDRIRLEVDKRWRDHMAMHPPAPIPRPPAPEEEKPPEVKPAPPPPPLDPATRDFLHWCFHGDEKAEELPSWESRHRLHRRGRRR